MALRRSRAGVLAAAFGAQGWDVEGFSELPLGLLPEPHAAASELFEQLGPAAAPARPAPLELVGRTESWTGMHELSTALLSVSFPVREDPVGPGALEAWQREVLRTLVESDLVWESRRRVMTAPGQDPFRRRGLPTTREGLRALAG